MSERPQAQPVSRVDVTPVAAALIRELRETHGALMFHQSGGCCDGSAPMCYPAGEFLVGERDVWLGAVEGCPFYISGPQFEVWQHTHLTLDVTPGRGSGFSLEAPEGVRFIIRSRTFSAAETVALAAAGPPPRGPQAA
ncbi:MAG: DUF779 domain-containing protein [Gammaproteobacteria bacterium]